MATIILADLDECIVDQARAGAAARGSSLEEDMRQLIEERAREGDPDRRRQAQEAVASMKAYSERMYAKYGPFPDTTEMIRQDRGAW